ncbi:MAG: hypothetical protein GF390_02355, partial [Candidatus Pacebacteria bacterium]|nr:hypothetical protein [Candidatus Paceibacterota bacterium]
MSNTQRESSAFTRYLSFVIDPTKYTSNAVASGGSERLRARLHNSAAYELMEEEDVENFHLARRIVAQRVADLCK